MREKSKKRHGEEEERRLRDGIESREEAERGYEKEE